MKLPYSYRQQFFAPILIASILGHITVFTAGAGLVSLSPKYSVQQAPSSMEVTITKVEPEKKQEIILSQTFITSEISEKTVPVKEMVKPQEEKPKVSRPVYIPPVHGALNQAKPAYLDNPAPRYPEYARMQGWQGIVFLKVLVSSEGSVSQAMIEQSSGYKILDDSALRTIQTWRFLPVRVGNATFSSWIKIPVRFLLTEEGV